MKVIKNSALVVSLLCSALPAFANDADLFASRTKLTQQSGEAIYGAICVACHQKDGVGAAGAGAYPALASNPALEAADYPIQVILHGQKGMPPLKGLFTDEQVVEIVNYIRSNFGNDYGNDPATVEQVKAARDQ